MGFPNTIRPGFDFDEAILMAEFSQRAYRVFEAADDRDPGDVYRILYRDGWQYLHGFVNAAMGVRCFIARRGSSNQYVVVFRGSAYTTDGIEWTNMSSNIDDAMVPYEHRTGRFDSARAQLRVHRGGWNAFVVLRTEIEIFFTVLIGARLKSDTLEKLVEAPPLEQANLIAAMAAAVKAVHGESAARRVSRSISNALKQIQSQQKEVGDFSLDQMIASSSRLESVLAELAEADDHNLRLADGNRVEIYVTGHSLGGNLAQFCAVSLHEYWTAQDDFLPLAMKVYVIGSPKIGNRAFVDHYDRLLPDLSYRVENQLDPIVHRPQGNAPFPYNLQLMIPNVDFVRDGENYYARYESAGEPYNLLTVGYQNADLNVGGWFRLTLPIPFPHGPDGYKEMLIRARAWQQRFWKPAQNIVRAMFQEQVEQMAELQSQLAELRASVDAMAAEQATSADAESDESATATEIRTLQQQISALAQSVDELKTNENEKKSSGEELS